MEPWIIDILKLLAAAIVAAGASVYFQGRLRSKPVRQRDELQLIKSTTEELRKEVDRLKQEVFELRREVEKKDETLVRKELLIHEMLNYAMRCEFCRECKILKLFKNG